MCLQRLWHISTSRKSSNKIFAAVSKRDRGLCWPVQWKVPVDLHCPSGLYASLREIHLVVTLTSKRQSSSIRMQALLDSHCDLIIINEKFAWENWFYLTLHAKLQPEIMYDSRIADQVMHCTRVLMQYRGHCKTNMLAAYKLHAND